MTRERIDRALNAIRFASVSILLALPLIVFNAQNSWYTVP